MAADAMATAKKRAYEKQQAEAKQKKAEKNSEDSAKSSFDKPEPESPAGGGGAIPDAPRAAATPPFRRTRPSASG